MFNFHFIIRYALERMKIAFEKFINKVCTFPCHYQIVKCFIACNVKWNPRGNDSAEIVLYTFLGVA